ncbi:hypothetical protein OROHE_005556 [Orobanche hederae]
MTDFELQGDGLINWDDLLDNIELDFGWLDGAVDNLPDSGGSLSIEDINQCLLGDGVVLSDSPPKDSSSLSPDSSLPDSGCDLSIEDIDQFLVTDELLLSDSPPRTLPRVLIQAVVQTDERLDVIESNGGDGTVEDDDDSDDPAAKQRKRKLRNKDAAMRSRERKKLYVHDLEMKSKFYEAECRRLGHLLQCCVAENQALRFSLHNSKVFDASVSRQESAVLLLELLLLGSLLGPLGIICLLILPSQLLSTLEAGLLRKGAKELGRVAPRNATSDVIRCLIPESFMIGKGCKASKPRFKDEASWPLANLLVT